MLLLICGFAIGKFADPDEIVGTELLLAFVSLSVGIILFEGGLTLRFREVRETGTVVLRLITVGLLVTWVLSALLLHSLVGLDWPIAAVAAALLTVSGPTVIVPLLRHVRPTRRIGSLAKWEGIVNDPIGAVLAALVFEGVLHGGFVSLSEGGGWETLWQLLITLLVGSAIGGAVALLVVQGLRRYWMPDYLQNAAFLALVVCVFTATNHLFHEGGLVAVTVLGLALANQQQVTLKHVLEFKENLRVLLISVLFVLLASRVQLEELRSVGWPGLAFVLALILIVRPVSVGLATLGSSINRKERAFLAWLHPRGIVAAAVASLFALELKERVAAAEERGEEFLSPELVGQAEILVPITFLVIIGTVTVYGLSLAPLARWLGLSNANPQGIIFAGASTAVRAIAAAVQNEGFQVLLVDTNRWNISKARMAGLPTCYASVSSDYVHEEIDLGDIGRLLAMTPNDEVNALAALEFAEQFSRAEVYQLVPPDAPVQRTETVPAHRRGRLLFTPETTFNTLAQRLVNDAEIKSTQLTEDYEYTDFLTRYGESAIPLFIVEESGALNICTADVPASPKPGQKIIALVDKVEDVKGNEE